MLHKKTFNFFYKQNSFANSYFLITCKPLVRSNILFFRLNVSSYTDNDEIISYMINKKDGKIGYDLLRAFEIILNLHITLKIIGT